MSSFIVALTSGALLVLLALLFHAEERLGRRFALSTVRSWLDARIEGAYARLSHTRLYVGTGSIRVLFHYFVHACIDVLLRMSDWFAGHLTRLERRNRKIARTIKQEQERSHLDLIAEHKESTALSETERDELKRRSLEGK